ncbi:unnamed protein product [[Candida] boidinii]|nr:unnamed protein product [[Candida] boidinii]
MDRVENGFGIGVLILLSFEVIWDSNSSTGELFCNFNKLSSTSRIAVSLLDTLNTLEGGGGVEVNDDDERMFLNILKAEARPFEIASFLSTLPPFEEEDEDRPVKEFVNLLTGELDEINEEVLDTLSGVFELENEEDLCKFGSTESVPSEGETD